MRAILITLGTKYAFNLSQDGDQICLQFQCRYGLYMPAIVSVGDHICLQKVSVSKIFKTPWKWSSWVKKPFKEFDIAGIIGPPIYIYSFNVFVQLWFYFLALGQPYFTDSTLYSISSISWQLQQRSNRVDRHITNWLLLKNYGTRRTTENIKIKWKKHLASFHVHIIAKKSISDSKVLTMDLKRTNLTVRFRP